MLYLQKPQDPPSDDTLRNLRAADGYLELGLADEALREIEEIDPADHGRSIVRRMHIRSLLHLHRWPQAEKLSRQSAALFPDEEEFTVQRAFALHRMEHGAAAAAVLHSAPAWIRQTGILHYNLACYEARLGDLATARQCIATAIEMNAEMKKRARNDPDLAALWN